MTHACEYRAIVFDETLGLPTRELALLQTTEWLTRLGHLGILTMDFSPAPEAIAETLQALRTRFRKEDIFAMEEVGGTRVCVFLSQPREERVSCLADVAMIAARTNDFLRERLHGLGDVLHPAATVGHAFAIYNPQQEARTQLRAAVMRAIDGARSLLNGGSEADLRSALERIIVERQTKNVFQRVVDLETGEIRGYEALARGPAGYLSEPLVLLELAERVGMSLELDRVLFLNALERAAKIATHPVFINVLPSAFFDPMLSGATTKVLLQNLGIPPERLVLELSERHVVKNPAALMTNIQRLRDIGVRLAIDDVGSGYSGLDRIAAFAPDFLKIDKVLVHDIDKHPVQRSVLTALGAMANDISAAVIAEGIEQEEERQCLQSLGFTLGQGFLFAKPEVLPD